MDAKVRFIHWTVPYAHTSAGIRVIHYFCHIMRKLGYDSHVTSFTNKHWDCPKFSDTIKDTDIVIYPEIIRDNPLKAKNVVRYMLYFPTAYFGGGIIPANEMVIPYHEFLYEETVRHYKGSLTRDDILTLSSIEPGLFFPEEKTITNVCYIGKGQAGYPSVHLPPDCIKITHSWPSTREGTAELLRKTENLYCFDNHSAITYEAALCGCHVYLLNKLKKTVYSINQNEPSLSDENRDLIDTDKFAKKAIRFFNLEEICQF